MSFLILQQLHLCKSLIIIKHNIPTKYVCIDYNFIQAVMVKIHVTTYKPGCIAVTGITQEAPELVK